VHELVAVQAALHHRVHLTAAGESHRGGGSLVAVLGGDQRQTRDVEVVRSGDRADPVLRSHQDGDDQPGLGGLERAQQAVAVDG
jgi:hypothetical protein